MTGGNPARAKTIEDKVIPRAVFNKKLKIIAYDCYDKEGVMTEDAYYKIVEKSIESKDSNFKQLGFFHYFSKLRGSLLEVLGGYKRI